LHSSIIVFVSWNGTGRKLYSQLFSLSLLQHCFVFVFCFGSMAPRVTLRLRHLLASLKDVCQSLVDSHPDIVEAVDNLEAAVDVGFPVGSRARGKPAVPVEKRIRSLQNKIRFLRQQKRQLKQQVEDLTIGKKLSGGHRMTPEFVAKVALSWPTTCARGFSSAWNDLVGVGVSGCSRVTISNIRNSFAEIVKGNCVKEVERAVTLAVSAKSNVASSSASAAPALVSSLPSAVSSPASSTALAAVSSRPSAVFSPASAALSPVGMSVSAASAPVSAVFSPVTACAVLHIHDKPHCG